MPREPAGYHLPSSCRHPGAGALGSWPRPGPVATAAVGNCWFGRLRGGDFVDSEAETGKKGLIDPSASERIP